MVIMSNELWDKIKENLCLDDSDGLATRINNDVQEVPKELLAQMVYTFVMGDEYMELDDANADMIGNIEDLLEKEE